MTISDERAKPSDFEIAVQRVTNWLVKRQAETSPAAKAFVGDISLLLMAAKSSAENSAALLAEREAAGKVREAIHSVHSQHADDLCWMDIDRIFEAAGLPVPDRTVGDKEAMKANCARFIDTMCAGGKWKNYAELEAALTARDQRIAELEHMPCDSPAANEWLNRNAPKKVVEALWAWRRISVEGLTKHKEHIGQLTDQVATQQARITEMEGLLREWLNKAIHPTGDLASRTERALALTQETRG